jgi:hypothetical protein
MMHAFVANAPTMYPLVSKREPPVVVNASGGTGSPVRPSTCPGKLAFVYPARKSGVIN